MRGTFFDWFDWTSGIGMLAVIAWLLYRRKLLREFPIFSFYVIYHLVYALVHFYFWLRRDYLVFWLLFWLRELIDVVVILSVLHEIFSKVLEPYPTLRKAGSRLYITVMVSLGSVGLCLAITYNYFSISKIDDAGMHMIRALHLIEVGMVFSLFIFCKVFGLAWRHALFGIALGFGLKAAMQTVAQSAALQTGYPGNRIAGLVGLTAYTVGLLVWTYFLATVEKTVPVQALAASPQLTRWNIALEQILAR